MGPIMGFLFGPPGDFTVKLMGTCHGDVSWVVISAEKLPTFQL